MSHEERSPQGEHRSAPVLTVEQSHSQMYEVIEAARVLAQSHETLRAELMTALRERDAALAEVARMRPIVDMACSVEEETAVLQVPDEPTDDDVYEIQGDYWESLMAAVDAYRAEVQP